jgi:hypothetical protein
VALLLRKQGFLLFAEYSDVDEDGFQMISTIVYCQEALTVRIRDPADTDKVIHAPGRNN